MQAYLQVILAICIVIILFVIAFTVYNAEYLKTLRSTGVSKERVEIFTGVNDFNTFKDIIYDTVNASSDNYRKVGPSYNQAGGVEFTYNFWLYIKGGFYEIVSSPPQTDTGLSSDTINKQTVLFVKGSKNIVNYKNVCGNTKTDIMVKCPLVKLEEGGKYLTVEFNTLQGYDAVKAVAPAVCTETSTDWTVKNAHKIALGDFQSATLINKWNMVTVVLQDTYPQDELPYRNKVRCRIYLNGLLELDKYTDGRLEPSPGEMNTLKTNTGHLYVAPNISIAGNSIKLPINQPQNLMMANLTYFNYAINQAEIDSEMAKGVANKTATMTTTNISELAVASKSSSLVGKPL
jgi:hypothetical protein